MHVFYSSLSFKLLIQSMLISDKHKIFRFQYYALRHVQNMNFERTKYLLIKLLWRYSYLHKDGKNKHYTDSGAIIRQNAILQVLHYAICKFRFHIKRQR